jgi:hypothetical protein
MKKFLIILCAMAVVFGWTTSSVAVYYYDQNSLADAMVDSANPTTNYGFIDTLRIEGTAFPFPLGSKKMSYLKFDLSSIPDGMTFISAELGIYFVAKNSGGIGWIAPEVSLHRVSDDSWTEGGINYDNKPPPPGYVSDPFVDILQPQQPEYITWDLLLTSSDPDTYSWGSDYSDDLVDNFVSFRIQPAELDKNQWATFWSDENTYQPYLRIEYVPEPATVALLGLGGLLLRRKRRAKFVPIEKE